jgi:murein L,D-transpeptidase YafK
MSGSEWETLRSKHPDHAAFWAELAPIYDAFEQTHLVPEVDVEADGSYRLR